MKLNFMYSMLITMKRENDGPDAMKRYSQRIKGDCKIIKPKPSDLKIYCGEGGHEQKRELTRVTYYGRYYHVPAEEEKGKESQ